MRNGYNMFDYEAYKAQPLDRETELKGILDWAKSSLLNATEDWINLADETVKELLDVEIDYPVDEDSFGYDRRHDDEPVYDEGDPEWEKYGDIDDLANWFEKVTQDDPEGQLIFGELKEWYNTIYDAFDWPQAEIDMIDIEHTPPNEVASKIESIVNKYKTIQIPIIKKQIGIIEDLLKEASTKDEELTDIDEDDMMAEKSVAQDIAERIVSVATRTINELNQATASNATNVIKRGLLALKDLEDECANDSGMLKEDAATLASQTDDVTDVALRRFHADIRSWEAYAVQREDAKLSFSKIATYWNKIVNIYKSDEPSRRKTAAKSYGVPNYRYKVGQMVKVGNRYGKVVGVSKEGGTGKQVYEVKIDGKDNVRKCGLKEISSADSKKKVTKTISTKSNMTPEEAKKILDNYGDCILMYSYDIENELKSIKDLISRKGMDNILKARDKASILGGYWQRTVEPAMFKASGANNNQEYYEDLTEAAEALNIERFNGLSYFMDMSNTLHDLTDFFDFFVEGFEYPKGSPAWQAAIYKDEHGTIPDMEEHLAIADKWLNTYTSSAASKSIRSQIRPYKFQPSVGEYAEAGSFDDSYELIDAPIDVDEILDSIGVGSGYDFLLVKGTGGDVGEIWGGEGVYDDDVEMTRLN